MTFLPKQLTARVSKFFAHRKIKVSLTISVMPPTVKTLKRLLECGHLFQDKLDNCEIRDYLLAMPRRAREIGVLFSKERLHIKI